MADEMEVDHEDVPTLPHDGGGVSAADDPYPPGPLDAGDSDLICKGDDDGQDDDDTDYRSDDSEFHALRGDIARFNADQQTLTAQHHDPTSALTPGHIPHQLFSGSENGESPDDDDDDDDDEGGDDDDDGGGGDGDGDDDGGGGVSTSQPVGPNAEGGSNSNSIKNNNSSGMVRPAGSRKPGALSSTARPKPKRRRVQRKVPEPSPEIKFLLDQATKTFDIGDKDGAREILAEIIRINGKTHEAWPLLANISEGMGDRESAIVCKLAAASLEPGNVHTWIKLAAEVLEDLPPDDDGSDDDSDGGGDKGEGKDPQASGNADGKNREEREERRARVGKERARVLDRASLCYGRALKVDQTNMEARIGKAAVLLRQGKTISALGQYERALAYQPFNIHAVRKMAEVALEARELGKSCERAKTAYRRLVNHLLAAGQPEAEEDRFDWSDLRIYLECFTILEQWDQAARELKEISRWLLGRQAETYWDRWVDDDREWDLHDDRRIEVPEYEPGRYPQDDYGAGLKIDIRAKLCFFRINLGHDFEVVMHTKRLPVPTAPQCNRSQNANDGGGSDTEMTGTDAEREARDGEYAAAVDVFVDFPDCLKEIANAFLEREQGADAFSYLELYKRVAEATGQADDMVDAEFLVSQGRSYMALGDRSAAEECFMTAIEGDDDNIEARIELAKLYERGGGKEGREEAFLLVNEAMSLEAAAAAATLGGEERATEGRFSYMALHRYINMRKRRGGGSHRPHRPRAEGGGGTARKSGLSRHRLRRLINAEKRHQLELERTIEAGKKYRAMLAIQPRAGAGGDAEATRAWMASAKDLINDFRSYKDFYPWEKYVKFLGYGGGGVALATGVAAARADGLTGMSFRLKAMAERLQQNLADGSGQEQTQPGPNKLPGNSLPQNHRGIPFDEWLELFLDYALGLARGGEHREAYVICHAARDSIVWQGSAASMFRIHVAWATCAVLAGDEETCVAVARFFMKDGCLGAGAGPGTDSNRMFAAMCRVCQTPVSWYTSGPVQKFILRQIKLMDERVMKVAAEEEEEEGVGDGPVTGGPRDHAGGTSTSDEQKGESGSGNQRAVDRDGVALETTNNQREEDAKRPPRLDVCLLTIYGHILFSTTSHTYALSYFARAASIDPHNPLINLSAGLAYLHYALKRQAANRQYLITQGFSFLFRYYEDRIRGGGPPALRPANLSGREEGGDDDDDDDDDGGRNGDHHNRTGDVHHSPRQRGSTRASTTGERQEAHFNIARAYSLLGLGNLANEYYQRVLDEAERARAEAAAADEDERRPKASSAIGNEDLVFEAAYNIRTTCFLLGDAEGAKDVTERWLVLE